MEPTNCESADPESIDWTNEAETAVADEESEE